jgi:hypothetical protein
METCHNRKKKVQVVSTAIVKSTEPIVGIKTQPIKSRKIPIRYPYMIYSSIEHRSRECLRKIEIQNMFRTKLVSSNAMTTLKLLKTHNVPINVIDVATTRS